MLRHGRRQKEEGRRWEHLTHCDGRKCGECAFLAMSWARVSGCFPVLAVARSDTQQSRWRMVDVAVAAGETKPLLTSAEAEIRRGA